jgi:hypothetical protein
MAICYKLVTELDVSLSEIMQIQTTLCKLWYKLRSDVSTVEQERKK